VAAGTAGSIVKAGSGVRVDSGTMPSLQEACGEANGSSSRCGSRANKTQANKARAPAGPLNSTEAPSRQYRR
jgi:hypothetical protein